jgi:hypothetical protein
MSLSGLATVEMQLIMHFCDKVSLLQLARCSQFSLSCASSDFAWRSLNPLPLSCTVPSCFHSVAQITSSLLRFCDWAVEWSSPKRDKVSQCKEVEVDAVLALPRVTSIEITDRRLEASHTLRLFRHPMMRNLTSLSLGSAVVIHPDCAPLLATFTRLISLRCAAEEEGLFCSVLPSLTNLVSLHLRCDDNEVETKIQAIRGLKLQNLSLRNVGWTSLHVLLAPNLAALRSLQLECVWNDGIVDWTLMWSSFPLLSEVGLTACENIDQLLQGMLSSNDAVPLLRELRLHTFLLESGHTDVPSEDILSSLMQHRTALHMTLAIISQKRATPTYAPRASKQIAKWHKTRDMFAVLESLYAHRTKVEELP